MGRIANILGLGKSKKPRRQRIKRPIPVPLTDEIRNIPEDNDKLPSKAIVTIPFVRSPVMHYLANGTSGRSQRTNWKISGFSG